MSESETKPSDTAADGIREHPVEVVGYWVSGISALFFFFAGWVADLPDLLLNFAAVGFLGGAVLWGVGFAIRKVGGGRPDQK